MGSLCCCLNWSRPYISCQKARKTVRTDRYSVCVFVRLLVSHTYKHDTFLRKCCTAYLKVQYMLRGFATSNLSDPSSQMSTTCTVPLVVTHACLKMIFFLQLDGQFCTFHSQRGVADRREHTGWRECKVWALVTIKHSTRVSLTLNIGRQEHF